MNVLSALVRAINARTDAALMEAAASRQLATAIDQATSSVTRLASASERIATALDYFASPEPATAKWDVGTRETESHGE